MTSRNTSSIPNQDDAYSRILYHDLMCSQACSWCSKVLPGMSSALPGVPLVVTRPPITTYIFCWCSQVHPKTAASVLYTLQFDHPGILIPELSDTPRGSQYQRYILLLQITYLASPTGPGTTICSGTFICQHSYFRGRDMEICQLF